MKDIGLFVDKESREATLLFHHQLQELDWPEELGLAINNIKGGHSSILLKDGNVAEISLANCYSLADMVRELARLILKPRYDNWEDLPEL